MAKQDFLLPQGHYFGSHSAGRPLQTSQANFNQSYFEPWAGDDADPWPQWLAVIERFTGALGQLLNADASGFCPQSNVSSGLAKVAMALPQLQAGKKVLLSEHDFPSIGYVLQHALPQGREQLQFIPRDLNLSDPNVWAEQMQTADIAMVMITHGYSNLGRVAPLPEVVALAKQRGILSCVDVAQTAGVMPIDLSQLQPDILLGSSLKWLCGGAGAGFLWLAPQHLATLQPKDVGWFSHEQPFAMDIHDFRYHPSALRFWGGTPSVAPYAFAAHSIEYLASKGSDRIRHHNLMLQSRLIEQLGERVVSPHLPAHRSGTAVLNLGKKQSQLLPALMQAQIHADERPLGVRISPHCYNDSDDIDQLIKVVKAL